VLRVLKDPEVPDAAEKPADKAAEKAAAADGEEKKKRTVETFGASEGDAEVLDEDSSDPEIQLDLARAYISMGDKEAARVILEEVGNNGNEEQREEARKMLNHLTP
jgi:FimV-like protein